ncbi:glutamyl-tRNA amidotransferase [Helicobacter pylori]|nr:glutamyl-tRNA amidotransferase [Helicobacter pylori]
MFGGKKCLICLWLVIIITLDFVDNFTNGLKDFLSGLGMLLWSALC